MAKLRGKHWKLSTLKNAILNMMDKYFPSNSPHHLVIMSDTDYRDRLRKQEENKWK